MLIFKINALTNLIAFIIGSIQLRYFNKGLKIVYYFVAFGMLTEVYTRFHKHFIMKNSMAIGHFYFPIAFLIISFFYFEVLKDFIKPYYILIIVIAFEIYCIINSLFIQSLNDYASIEGSVSAMVLFLFSVAFFTKVMVEAKITKLAKEPL